MYIQVEVEEMKSNKKVQRKYEVFWKEVCFTLETVCFVFALFCFFSLFCFYNTGSEWTSMGVGGTGGRSEIMVGGWGW